MLLSCWVVVLWTDVHKRRSRVSCQTRAGGRGASLRWLVPEKAGRLGRRRRAWSAAGAEFAAQLEQLAVGRAERGVEGGDLVVVLLFECGELGAEGPNDVAGGRPVCGDGSKPGRRCGLLLAAEVLDAGPERGRGVGEGGGAAGFGGDAAEGDRVAALDQGAQRGLGALGGVLAFAGGGRAEVVGVAARHHRSLVLIRATAWARSSGIGVSSPVAASQPPRTAVCAAAGGVCSRCAGPPRHPPPPVGGGGPRPAPRAPEAPRRGPRS